MSSVRRMSEGRQFQRLTPWNKRLFLDFSLLGISTRKIGPCLALVWGILWFMVVERALWLWFIILIEFFIDFVSFQLCWYLHLTYMSLSSLDQWAAGYNHHLLLWLDDIRCILRAWEQPTENVCIYNCPLDFYVLLLLVCPCNISRLANFTLISVVIKHKW